MGWPSYIRVDDIVLPGCGGTATGIWTRFVGDTASGGTFRAYIAAESVNGGTAIDGGAAYV